MGQNTGRSGIMPFAEVLVLCEQLKLEIHLLISFCGNLPYFIHFDPAEIKSVLETTVKHYYSMKFSSAWYKVTSMRYLLFSNNNQPD